MQPCLHPATLKTGLDLPTLIATAAGAGFHAMETSASALMAASGDDAAVARALFAGHAVVPVHTGWSAGLRSDRAAFAAAVRRTETEMACAAMCGSRGGTLVLPFRPEPDLPQPDDDDTIDRIRLLADIAHEHGLSLMLEWVGLHIPDAPAGTYHDLPATLDLIGRVGRSNVGVLLDSYHWYLSGGTVAQIAAIPAGVPLFVHINDAPPGDVRTLTDAMRVLPGAGVIDLAAFLGAIGAKGYAGAVSVELFSEALRALDPADAARQAYDATVRAISAAAGRSV